nr:hypothetical protein [Tanacetum cinerariifolium]
KYTAFCSCDLVLRFAAAFWFCALLIEDSYCVLPGDDSASFKTWLRFVSRLGCVLSRRLPAFYLKTCYVLSQDLVAFCLKTSCVLSQDLLRFVSRLERPRVYSDLSPEEKDWYNADIWATHILLQGLPKDINTLINHYINAKDIWNNVKMLLEGSELTKEDRESQFVNNMLPEWGRFVTTVKLNRGLRDSNYDQLYAYLMQHETDAKENKMILERFSQHTVDPLDLMSNVSNPQRYSPSSSTLSSTQVSQHLADNPHLDSRDESTGWRYSWIWGVQNRVGNANPGQARQVKCYNCNGTWHIARNCTQPKRPQNSEYYKDKMLLMQAQENGADDCDAFDSDVDEGPTAQTMFMANLSSTDPVTDEARPSYDSDILSEVQDHDHYQDAVCAHHEEHAMHDCYVKENEVPVVHSNVSFVLNDAYMMIYNDMYEPHAQSVSNTSRNIVVENSLTAELATYKEQVEQYERRAKFELTKREQNINEQLRLVISDRNFKKETLKRKLHFIKLQLASTINHNKSMVEEVTFLKKDFKQKENKYLEDFLDMKSLKEKFEDRLLKQDQSLQTVHMLCRPKPYYNELNKVAIGYKNPLCLTRAKQVQPALYNGHEIIKDNYAPTISHNDNQEELINHFSKLEVNHLNLQLKYQNLKDSFGNNPPTPDKDTPDFDSVFIIGKMQASLQGKDNVIRQLKKQISHLQETRSDTDRTLKVRTTDSQITQLTKQVSNLQAQNDSFRVENDKIKQHYKELYDSIKITRAKHIEQVTSLTTKNVNLKAQILEKVNSVSKDHVKPKVLVRGKYAIDVEPIVPHLRNNRDAHLGYLMHLKESVETIRDIVEEAKVVRPLDRYIVFACRYTKYSLELLEYAIGTYP